MADATLQIDVSAATLEQLRALAGQVVGVVGGANHQLEAALSGDAADHPLGGLPALLEGIASHASEIPGIHDAVDGLEGLIGGLPGGFGDVAELIEAIEHALEFVQPIVAAALDGGLEEVLETALEQAGDVASSLTRGGDEVSAIFSELQEFFGLFEAMLGWEAAPPDPRELADLLAHALAGVRLDHLDAPAAALEAALAPLAAALPAGADLTAWQSAAPAQLAFWQGLDTRLAGSIDWSALEAELTVAAGTLHALVAARDRVLLRATSALANLALPRLPEVAVAIRAVPAVQLVKMTPVFDGLRRQLQGMIDDIQTWEPTEAGMRVAVRQFAEGIRHHIDEGPFGQLRVMLVNLEERMLRALDELPFRGLAHDVSNALRDVAEALDSHGPESVRRTLTTFLEGLDRELHDIAVGAVHDSIGALWDTAEQAVGQAAELLGQLRDGLEGILGTLQAFADEVGPVITPIVDRIHTLDTELEAFDLEEAAQTVVDALHELRDTVAGLDISLLPEPAVALVKQGAEALRRVDVAGVVNEPLAEALAAIDPTPALETISSGLAAAVAPLRDLDPGSLAGDLDTPVDALLSTLSRLDPAQLEAPLRAALDPIKAPLRALDFTALLAPLTRLHVELMARLNTALDPEPILAPLEAAFQPMLDLVELLDPLKLLELLQPHTAGLAESVGQAVGPPAAIKEAGGTLKTALAPGVDADDALFGFRPGDVLTPLIELHHKLASAVDALDDSVLEPAAAALRELTHGRLTALDPGTIDRRVGELRAQLELEFTPAAVSERLAEAALAHNAVSVRVSAAAALDLPAADRAIAARVVVALPALDPLALVPDVAAAGALLAASAGTAARIDLAPVRSAYPRLAGNLADALPGFLAGDLGAASLRQAVRDLDPGPVRDEVNALFDQVGAKLVGIQDALFATLEEAAVAIEEFFLPVGPGELIAVATRLHAAIKEQLAAIGPAALRAELALTFDAIKRQAEALNPAALAAELGTLRDGVIETLEDVAGGLLPDPAPLHDLQTQLAGLKPSRLLDEVAAAARPLTDIVAALDAKVLFGGLIDALARIRDQAPEVVATLEAAFDEVLAAFPEGGVTGVSASASASLG
jgi:hypothetical protein